MNKYLTSKDGRKFPVRIIESTSDIPDELVIAYATNFWSGVWDELLLYTDKSGNRDKFGTLSIATQEIASALGVDTNSPQWHMDLWRVVGEVGSLPFLSGQVTQFWTNESARQALESYVSDPYRGKIIIIEDGDDIAGFSSYCIGDEKRVMQRFPDYQGLQISSGNYGIFLDHAISAEYRGQGLGTALFDLRIAMALEDDAEFVAGQTIETQPAQFYGNYHKRGMSPIHKNPTEDKKFLFVAKRDDLVPR